MAHLQPKKMSREELARQENKIMLGKQLIRACRFGDLKRASDLVAKGADPNYASIGFETPVFAASGAGSVDLLEFLVKAGADLGVKTSSSKQLPIHNAVSSGSLEATRWLVQRGAHLTSPAYDGSTVLHIAVQAYRIGIIYWCLGQQGSKSLVKKQDYEGLNVAHVVVSLSRLPRRLDVLEALIRGGVDLNQETDSGDTVLHRAAMNQANPFGVAAFDS